MRGVAPGSTGDADIFDSASDPVLPSVSLEDPLPSKIMQANAQSIDSGRQETPANTEVSAKRLGRQQCDGNQIWTHFGQILSETPVIRRTTRERKKTDCPCHCDCLVRLQNFV